MSTDNQIRLTEQIQANTTQAQMKANYIPDKINDQAYKKMAKEDDRAQEIGMYANWDEGHPNNVPKENV